MIKILNAKEVSSDEIFSRVVPSINVEGIVADIIDNVRKNGDRALFALLFSTTRSGIFFGEGDRIDVLCTLEINEYRDIRLLLSQEEKELYQEGL